MALTVNKTQITPLPGALVETVQLGEAMSAGQSFCFDSSGKAVKADADGAGLYRGVGVLMFDNQGSYNVTGDYASGDYVSAVLWGPIAGITGMDEEKSVWVSTTAGGMTQTKPSGGGVFPCGMGWPLASDKFFVCPQPLDTGY